MKSNGYALLGVLQAYAPNGPAQQLCTNMVHKAQADGASDKEVEQMLANAISDGLTHGNWPWAQVFGPATKAADGHVDEMLSQADYDRLRFDLVNAHIEDFVNLVTVALTERPDVEVSHFHATNLTVGRFTLPAAPVCGRTYPDRPFSISVAERKA